VTKILSTDNGSIHEARNVVRRGGLIAYPTDTVYALGCDPFSPEAVERVVRSKGRSKGSLPILVESTDVAQGYGSFSDLAIRLAKIFWPGPLTLVVPAKASFPSSVTGDSLTVGLRVPNHEIARKLIKSCGGALVGTSANLSGNPSPRTADEVMRELKDRVDMIIDGGIVLAGKESTVAKVTEGTVSVLREGAIPREEILKEMRPGIPL
jgi:L-threonylcarbamoyladenylate synthase